MNKHEPLLPQRSFQKGRLFAFIALLIATVWFASPSIHHVNANMSAVGPDDPHIHYVGRWDDSVPDTYRGYWAGTSFTTAFTGGSVRLRLGTPYGPAGSDLYTSIDGEPFQLYKNAYGTVNLTPEPLSSGNHTLTVVTRNIRDVIVFKGLLLDEGAQTIAPPKRDRLIEFIGDSITVGYKTPNVSIESYAWLTGEQLNADHTQIAYTGICLVDGISCNGLPPSGMSEQYFKLETLDYAQSPAWDTAKSVPDVVVINIGTNDARANIDSHTFQATYVEFLEKLRQIYPRTQLVVLLPLNGYMNKESREAATIRQKAGDQKLHIIATNGWLSEAAGDYTDQLHPSAQGNIKMAERLTQELKTTLGW
ncbi:SGNH/GDSL hydrolase family protein [Saccharibacillus sp. JS10]|uniref:SGNH/GDSL hydrolase family protein n=1 Tax=Saccharibacillus sp. JS10 TaxID=2950552 RepID=UPI00210DCAAD|nr:SGNH/GDSL hydrolase family protein [Saccharibacillus sp. JS10]MCQ4088668.1 GDSL-type esterase/lipase family protein [Saccharibacillus sp. JS10]